MNPELRTNLRISWIQCLFEFASQELQRYWITRHPEIVVYWDECMLRYFGDLNLGDGLENAVREGWLSLEEAETVAKFHHLANAYEPPPEERISGDEVVLRDPRWAEVVDAAREAWCRLRTIIADAAEREEMERSEKRWGKITERPS